MRQYDLNKKDFIMVRKYMQRLCVNMRIVSTQINADQISYPKLNDKVINSNSPTDTERREKAWGAWEGNVEIPSQRNWKKPQWLSDLDSLDCFLQFLDSGTLFQESQLPVSLKSTVGYCFSFHPSVFHPTSAQTVCFFSVPSVTTDL